MEVFGFEANFSAGVLGELGVILRLKIGICIKKCAEISMSGLTYGLTIIHAEVCTHDSVETKSGVGNLRESRRGEIGAP